MSTYDDASLVLVPSGYKNGVVFSQKPMDANGQLTFTRASGATRVGPNGYIEKVRTNLLLQSNTFSTTWATNNGTSTSGQTGYDGTNNAWLLTATSSLCGVLQTISQGGMVTQSVYAKAGTASWIALRLTDGTTNNLTYADLTNRVFGTTGPSFVRGSITDVGSGWSRISVTINQSAYSQIGYYAALGSGNLSTTNETIYIQDAQLEAGDIATDYIPTTTAAVSVGPVSGTPRLDYLGSDCGRLLLEPQRSNLFTHSEQFDNATWTKTGATITANAAVSPDGYTNADLQTGFEIYQQKTQPNATACTMSVFVKKDTAASVTIRYIDTPVTFVGGGITYTYATNAITINQSANASVSGEAINYGNGWYRLILKYTSAASVTFNYQGIQASGSFIYGAQFETSAAYATSYIPTLGTAVTRVADAASKTGITSLIGQTEGVIFIDFVATAQNADGAGFSIITIFGDGNENFQLYAIGTALYWYAWIGSILIDQTATQTLVAGDRYKVAYAYKSGDWALYINGVQKRTNTAATVPATSQFNLNASGFGASPVTAKNEYNQVLLFKTRLDNATLQSLTTL